MNAQAVGRRRVMSTLKASVVSDPANSVVAPEAAVLLLSPPGDRYRHPLRGCRAVQQWAAVPQPRRLTELGAADPGYGAMGMAMWVPMSSYLMVLGKF